MRLRVDGGSMLPLIRPGDVLWVQVVPAQSLAVGDVVVVRRARDLVAHRLVRGSGNGWQTKGDHLPYLDPVTPGDSILGRVTAIEDPRGRLEPLNVKWAAANRRLARLSAWEGDLVSRVSGRSAGAKNFAGQMRSVLRRAVSAPFRLAIGWMVAQERRRA
jgi:hypothetical protein